MAQGAKHSHECRVTGTPDPDEQMVRALPPSAFQHASTNPGCRIIFRAVTSDLQTLTANVISCRRSRDSA
jgi:hypothetical protein